MSVRGFRGVCAPLLAVAVWAAGPSARAEPAEPARPTRAAIELAVAVDGLPAVAASTPAWSKAQVLRAILGTLVLHHVSEPVGVFNARNVDDDPQTLVALRDWIAAGFMLGDQTDPHESADEVPTHAFRCDTQCDEELIGALDPAAGRGVRYFRYPLLDQSKLKDDAQIRRFLSVQRDRIADASVGFEARAFSAAYQRCSQRGDTGALAALLESYLDYALAALFWSADNAQRVLGRPVPQVLLLHADLFTAQNLNEILSAYERAGVRFVSLAQALADPAHQTARDGDTSLVRALSRERHAPLSNFVPIPPGLLAALCR